MGWLYLNTEVKPSSCMANYASYLVFMDEFTLL